jgi:hypothetical protein
MRKKNSTGNLIWLIVLGMLLLALVVGGLLFFFKPFQTTNQGSIVPSLSPEDKMTQEVLYNPTPQADITLKPADKIIFKAVNFHTDGTISELVMFVPAVMVDAVLTIDGTAIDAQLSQQGNEFEMRFVVPESLRKKEITFQVIKDNSLLATCSVVNGESVIVSGDCLF